jgi:hypothetical protein
MTALAPSSERGFDPSPAVRSSEFPPSLAETHMFHYVRDEGRDH